MKVEKAKKEKSAKRREFEDAFKAWLKSMIFPVILAAIIFVGIFVVINYKNLEVKEDPIKLNGYEGDDKPIVMENDRIKFTMDPITTQFQVEVKSTGKVWYSNPQDIESDSVALPAEKNFLKSTLVMTYNMTQGLETKYNNYQYSIENGIYEIETGDNSVRVRYSLGDVERTYVIPPVCTEADFEKWISQMDVNGLNMTKQYYKKYDINNLGKKDNKDELLENYPIMETEIIYVLRNNTSQAMRTKLEQSFEAAGYTYEDFEHDQELDLSQSSSDKPIFNLDMIYTLDGDDLVVKVPLNSLEYKEEYPIYTITVLPYFGAGGKNDEGYLLVPEGGGGIINFNNGKTSQPSYYASVYGRDMCLSKDAVVTDPKSTYGVFGIAAGNDSFLCLLEEGSPYAAVQADINGRTNSYNYANAMYSICSGEQYKVGDIANSSIYVFLEDLPDETLTQRYRFVDSGSYVDMAKVYQNYLKDTYGSYLSMNNDAEAPVTVEIVGAVDKVRQILGVPVSRPLKLTTYKEAENMIRTLKSEGMNNLSIKMTGWCNGGENQKILRKAKTIHALGSKKDLQSAVNTANDLGVDVYLDGTTHYAYKSNIFHGFFSFTDAAKFLTKERAELFIYSAVTYAAREGAPSYYLLHTGLAQELGEVLAKTAQKFNAGICFRDTGKDLSSDFYKKNPTSRQATKELQRAQLQRFDDAGQKIMINAGNDFAVPYSDVVTKMNLRGNEYTIMDGFVPFYQLAIHGMVDYTGDPLNLCGNTEEELLTSAEYGAGLYFTLMEESAFALQKTLYTEYYGADYAAWHDRMMEIYTRYNRELGHIFNQEMVGHERVTEKMACTTYADGTKVYVNYDFEEETAPDGTVVPARDYKVVR